MSNCVCACSGWQFGTMNAIRSLLMYAENPVGPRTSSPAAIGTAIQKSLQQIAGCFARGKGGGGTRWPSFLEGILEFMDAYPTLSKTYWTMLSNLTTTWRESGIDWERYYAAEGDVRKFPATFPHGPSEPTHAGINASFHHGVNNAEGLKFGAVQYRLWH